MGTSAHELTRLVNKLVCAQKEGEWWDFKRGWPSKEDLLYDIICLANNTEFRNSYLIIGVDEDSNYAYRDVSSDASRRDTQKIVDFLKSQPFAGDNFPRVHVQTISPQNDVAIDVVCIEGSKNTPYFLKRNHLGIHAGAICTRTMDTNTPKGSSANYRQTEMLWRNHFGLTETPIERVKLFLQDSDGWQDSLEHSEGQKEFYAQYPEYTIERISDDKLGGYEYYHFEQTDKTPHWYEIFVRYHQTVIVGMQGVALDGGRYFTSVPDRAFIGTPSHSGQQISNLAYTYCFFIEGTLNYLMHRHFYHASFDDEIISYERFQKSIVVYKDENEKMTVERLILSDTDSFEQELLRITPSVYISDEHTEIARKSYIDSLKVIRFIQDKLEEIRGVPYPCKIWIKEDGTR